jgi:hypothetical protein
MVHLDAGRAVGTQHESHCQESLQDECHPCAASEHFCPWSSAISNRSACLASLSAPSLVAVSVQLCRGVLQSSVQSCGIPAVAVWIPSRVHDSEQLVRFAQHCSGRSLKTCHVVLFCAALHLSHSPKKTSYPLALLYSIAAAAASST